MKFSDLLSTIMKFTLTIIFILQILVTQGQSDVFNDRATSEFRWTSLELMKKNDLNTCIYYDVLGDSAVFNRKEIYNFDDSTYIVKSYNKHGKLISETYPIYDTYSTVPDTGCCPIIIKDFDSMGRCIKIEAYYPYDMYKAKDAQYFVYIDSTNYLKLEINERTVHNKRVVTSETKQYEYISNYLGPLCRKTYYTLINHEGIISYLEEERCVDDLGLLKIVTIYNSKGEIKTRYKIEYENVDNRN